MILESIVTTIDAAGRVNIAPMGPIVRPPSDDTATDGDASRPTFCLRPYDGSQTCRNLLSNGNAVIHVTDDVLLLARAAIGHVDPQGLVCPAENATPQHVRLIDCHRWFAVEVTQRGGTPPRHELIASCVADGVVRSFFGFNRAKHAVIEAAILATRIGLLGADAIRNEMMRLESPIEKTSGPDEREAFELLKAFIDQKLSAASQMER